MAPLEVVESKAVKRKPAAASKKVQQPTKFKSAELVQPSDVEGENASEIGSQENTSHKHATIMTDAKLTSLDGSSNGSEGSINEESSEEEVEAEDQGGIMEKTPTRLLPPKKMAAKSKMQLESSKKHTYKPPPGFTPDVLEGRSTASRIFAESNLKGKQIWYFTAPASVNILALQEISLADVRKGTPVIQHDDDDYGFVSEPLTGQDSTRILVKMPAYDGYRIVPKPIDQVLHLQQMVNIPTIKGFHKDPPTQTSLNPPARLQPKGLKMRFHPMRFGKGTPEIIGSNSSSADEESSNASDEEIEDDPTSKIPPLVPISKKLKKLKGKEPAYGNGEVMTDVKVPLDTSSSSKFKTESFAPSLKLSLEAVKTSAAKRKQSCGESNGLTSLTNPADVTPSKKLKRRKKTPRSALKDTPRLKTPLKTPPVSHTHPPLPSRSGSSETVRPARPTTSTGENSY